MKISGKILEAVVKKIDRRIAKLRKRLASEKQDKSYNSFDDCASYYTECILNTEASIEELIKLRESFNDWDWLKK